MFQTTYYAVFFGFSVFLMLLYVFRWRKQFNIHMTVVFVLIPVANLSYLLMYSSDDPLVAAAALKIVYVGGIFLPWLVTMCMARMCHIQISRLIRMSTFLINTAVYMSVLSIGYSGLFYRKLSFTENGGNLVLIKEYGPMHTVNYIVLILYLAAELIIVLYTLRKRKQVSRRVLTLLFIPIPLTIFGYFANQLFLPIGIELMPFAYVFAQLVYLLIAYRMVLYNVSEMVIESEVQSGETGFITLDLKERYLGSNETAKRILPDLAELTVDRTIREQAGGNTVLAETVLDWVARFLRDPEDDSSLYVRKTGGEESEEIYRVEVNFLYDGSKKCGYQIFLQNDTQNQKYIRLLDQYNSDLQEEVTAKTARIIAMHDNLILSMAAMVESRDNSTGGHIRRTSEGVRILVSEIREAGTLQLSDEFCRNIIKAAPMHDLGKIAVDDAILRKPGRFTPDEFEKMKSHASEGARIVHNILKDTDDDAFRVIAENVAHYHHERMDGSGYPDGLKGEKIPLEARIMAIADVYDALVSKRVYKEKFSFEKADSIILEGMGTQFDERLRPYYEAARPKLEAFYLREV